MGVVLMTLSLTLFGEGGNELLIFARGGAE
jgi:hypothetical protein